MKYIVGLFLAFSVSFAHAQLYPIVENGVVLHMKESKFYSENNYGGYIIKGCNVIYKDKSGKKIMIPLDIMSHYTVSEGQVKIVSGVNYAPFEPNNHEQFVDGLMNHRYYCVNQHLLRLK